MPDKNKLTHVDSTGDARMVDVGGKSVTLRTASAMAWVNVGPAAAEQIERAGGTKKGNVLQTARLAGISAAKRTSELIPLCHPIVTDFIDVRAELVGSRVKIISEIRCEGKTGVEMEAMTAVSVAALTVYDMVKSISKAIEIGPVKLLEKTGGKSGTYRVKG